MPGIYIAAVISTVAVVGIWGVIFFRRAPAAIRPVLPFLFLVQLPMSWLTYAIVRVPVSDWYAGLVGKGSTAFLWIKSFEAPLTEEPAKLWPLLLLPFIRRIDPKQVLFAGIALGLGFGVGEIWLIAHLFVTHQPDMLAHPWYHFFGGVQERFIASFAHAAFTGVAAAGLYQGVRAGLRGVGTAMAGHYLLNIPILLPHLFGFSKLIPHAIWIQIVTLYILIYFFWLWFSIWKRCFGHAPTFRWLRGVTSCPSCGTTFVPDLCCVSVFLWNWQRCPHCRQWHWFRWHPPPRNAEIR